MRDIITLKDMRWMRYCAGGSRRFAKQHNLNWAKFLSEGLPAEDLEKTGDAMALKIVEAVRGRG